VNQIDLRTEPGVASASRGKGAAARIREEMKQLRKHRELFFLALPGVLYKLVFHYLPMIGILLAFKLYRYDLGMFGSKWVGFDNFRFFFVSNDAWRITRNTILYNFTYILLGTAVAIAFALLLNEIAKGFVKLFQTVMFLPHFISMVIVGFLTFIFLDHEYGYLNRLLGSLGLEGRNWYFETEPWIFILPLVSLWKGVGFSTLIYYAGIMGINPDYYEAARIDGASRLQMAARITVPLLTPLILILFILGLSGIFRGDFGLHYFVPANIGMNFPTTDIIDTYVYRALMREANIGMSAAIGLFQSVVGFFTILLANYTIKRINSDNALF